MVTDVDKMQISSQFHAFAPSLRWIMRRWPLEYQCVDPCLLIWCLRVHVTVHINFCQFQNVLNVTVEPKTNCTSLLKL